MRAFLVLAVLVLAAAPVAPATADPLVADAGFSVAAYDGAPAALSGRAFGGVAPYAYAWSLAGDASRFADPSAADTTLDTAGLDGVVDLRLTVTDAAGDLATDEVRIVAGAAPVLLDASVPVVAGVPDEILLPGGGGPDRKAFTFRVPAGADRIEGTLSWPDASSDLDLDLNGPLGVTSGGQGRTSANPERVALHAPPQGFWQAQVKPVTSAGTTARLVVQVFPAGALPSTVTLGAGPYGELDAHVVRAAGVRGTAPYAFAWDLDRDGRFETAGGTATVARAAGVHLVPFKLTDAAGFEVLGHARLDVRDVDHAIRFSCAPSPGGLAAMEFQGSGGTCWVHGGHHTYALVSERATLRGVEGVAFAVEQQFAPSAFEAEDPAWALHVETSVDGISWSEVGRGRYALTSSRQYVALDLDGLAEEFRFFRVRAPLSFTQGLSGYLDHTEGHLLVDAREALPAPTLAQGSRAFACETDLLEDFFGDHPCWFGGIDRYDAPSFWHTYDLGAVGEIDAVEGSFRLAPWRSDDYGNNATHPRRYAETSAFLLTSVDGVTWTERAHVPAVYGADARFSILLDGVQARFVQVFPEPHEDFEHAGSEAPNHHPRGFFVDSRLTVTGRLPS